MCLGLILWLRMLLVLEALVLKSSIILVKGMPSQFHRGWSNCMGNRSRRWHEQHLGAPSLS
uniref:Uncharacterized protein n=1 Tax=Rhizophora mucronata TaxID=61149 RepID=A0A2P2N4Y5_RHIMU